LDIGWEKLGVLKWLGGILAISDSTTLHMRSLGCDDTTNNYKLAMPTYSWVQAQDQLPNITGTNVVDINE